MTSRPSLTAQSRIVYQAEINPDTGGLANISLGASVIYRYGGGWQIRQRFRDEATQPKCAPVRTGRFARGRVAPQTPDCGTEDRARPSARQTGER